MGWSLGYDISWNRDIGYGVPAICDHPGCNKQIHRGLSYVCGSEPYGGEKGCGLYFCSEHLGLRSLCKRCSSNKSPYSPKKDTVDWCNHKLSDESWALWRKDNPNEVLEMEKIVKDSLKESL